jgi:hypothetical protein
MSFAMLTTPAAKGVEPRREATEAKSGRVGRPGWPSDKPASSCLKRKAISVGLRTGYGCNTCLIFSARAIDVYGF